MDSYTPLPPEPTTTPAVARRRPFNVSATITVSLIFLVSLIGLIINQSTESTHPSPQPQQVSPPEKSYLPPSRGVEEGVSEKSFRRFSDVGVGYSWTNDMFAWQRTGYHFQPRKNWMNDPDAPLFHKGWYHFFYQYNPDSAIWGNITWGHAVSEDLINWFELPLAMVPDQWFDINGVWTGSATLLPDGNIVILYTGDTNDTVQVQNLAYPANISDPLLLEWVKYPDNPVLVPPPGIGSTDFRDPTTMWVGSDGDWRVTIGTKVNKTGLALVYTTKNFTTYEAVEGILHAVEGTGMWECVDFYPVSMDSGNGLDTSDVGPGIKHVLKASLDDDKHDYYAIGVYDPDNETWTPDDPEEDVGIGLRVDYGRYYASKTFYDQNKGRRVLWGWVGETDSEDDDLEKLWASLQTVPRSVVFDNKTGTNILQWPVEEVESLRSNLTEFTDVELAPGSVVPINISSSSQVDIIAEFEIDGVAANASSEADVGYNCSGGAVARGALGPFGLLVITTETHSELTPIYFYIAKGVDGNLTTFFCSDNSRSTLASDVDNRVYGGKVPVLNGETYSMRLLVDHSIVESFAQGGRTVITTRVYPTEAIYDAAHLFFFNNATGVNVTASIKVWQMDDANIEPYPL